MPIAKHSEAQIEKRLVTKVRELGGECYKFTSQSRRHVPDRLCILPLGIFAMVECKAPGKQLRPAQKATCQRFLELGHSVFLVDTYEKVDAVISRFKSLLDNRMQILNDMQSRN